MRNSVTALVGLSACLALIPRAPADGGFGAIETKNEKPAVAKSPFSTKEGMQAWQEFMDANDQRLDAIEKKMSDPLGEDKLAKLDSVLDNYEETSQKLGMLEEQKKALQDVEQKLDRMETMMRRASPEDTKADRDAMFEDWFHGVLRSYEMGELNCTTEQKSAFQKVEAEYKTLNIGSNTEGGYLAPIETLREIIKDVVEISPARSIFGVRTTNNRAVQQNRRTGTGSARRNFEQGTKTGTGEPTYGMIEIQVPEMYALMEITNEMLEDTAYDIMSEMREDVAEQFAVLEGYESINGNGIGEMEGLLVNSDLSYVDSGSATGIADADGTADGIIRLKYAIKTAYANNGRFILNRNSVSAVRRLKDAENRYIWQMGIAAGAPNTIDGDPYTEFPDMPSEGAGTLPIAFGDFKKAYKMVDRLQLDFLQDPYTKATSGVKRMFWRRRGGGRVILPEAYAALRCSA